MKAMFVSVILPTYRDWERLRHCLETLANQSYPQEQFEVIVVNNDPVEQCPFKLPADNMRLLVEAREGSYAARNRGMENAKGDILAFTDADCLPAGDWIENAVKYFQLDESLDRLAGNVLLEFNIRSSPAALHQQVFAFDQPGYASKGTSITANSWSRRRVFDRIGGFDERLMSNEDLQWGFRSHKAGFTIAFALDVVVRHPARTSIDSLLQKTRRVYGGYYARKGWQSLPPAVRLVLSLYPWRPPIGETFRAISSRILSVDQKLKVIEVIFRIRYTQWREHLELAKGKPPERT